jgi:hypothetical protein
LNHFWTYSNGTLRTINVNLLLLLILLYLRCSEEDLAHQIVIYGEIADEARSQGGQGKRYKDTL